MFGPASDDLSELERKLDASLRRDPAAAGEPMRRLFAAGGKRLRPAIVMLAGRLGSFDRDRIMAAAASVEIVHAATLVHDDLIDRSPTRRGIPTVAAREGAEAAVLVGDFHFAKAYREASRTGDAEVVTLLAGAVMVICAGELDQQAARFHFRPPMQDYLDRIERKTAALIAAAAEIGALLGGLAPEARAAAREFGRRFGIAFQIADDVLDYTGVASRVGKPVGHDLLEGSATLPLLLAWESEGPRLQELLSEGSAPSPAAAAEVVQVVLASGATERALEIARRHSASAREALAGFPRSEALATLEALSAIAVERSA